MLGIIYEMKKIFFYCLFAFLSILVLSLFSCSKSDDKNGTSIPTASIIGKWDLKSQMRGTTVVPLSACEEQYNQYQFLENLTYVEDWGYTNNGTQCTHYTETNTYSLSNNILITNSFDGIVYQESHSKILELTSTKLSVKTFYRKEKQGTTVTETNIPEQQQVTGFFEKLN